MQATALAQDQIRTRVKLEDVLGLYGHPVDGDLTITYDTDNTTLQIYFSEFAYGILHDVPGFVTTYRIEWKTSIMDQFYTYPEPVPDFWVDFGITDIVLFRAGEFDQYAEFEFVKQATLETFPPIPWEPTSCGPERI